MLCLVHASMVDLDNVCIRLEPDTPCPPMVRLPRRLRLEFGTNHSQYVTAQSHDLGSTTPFWHRLLSNLDFDSTFPEQSTETTKTNATNVEAHVVLSRSVSEVCQAARIAMAVAPRSAIPLRRRTPGEPATASPIGDVTVARLPSGRVLVRTITEEWLGAGVADDEAVGLAEGDDVATGECSMDSARIVSLIGA